MGPVVLGRKAAATSANAMEEEVQTEEKQGREQTDKRSTYLNGLGAVSDEPLEWKDLTRNNGLNPHKEFFIVVSASFFLFPLNCGLAKHHRGRRMRQRMKTKVNKDRKGTNYCRKLQTFSLTSQQMDHN